MKVVDSLDSLKGNSQRKNIQDMFVNQLTRMLKGIYPDKFHVIQIINYIITLPCFRNCIKNLKLDKDDLLKYYKISCNRNKYTIFITPTQPQSIFYVNENSPEKFADNIGKMHINVNYYNWVWLIENFFDFLLDKDYSESTKYIVSFKFIIGVKNSNLIDLPSAPSKYFVNGKLMPMNIGERKLNPKIYFEDFRNFIGSHIQHTTHLSIKDMTREEFMKFIGGGAFLVIYLKNIDGSTPIYQSYKIAQGFYDYLSKRYTKRELNAVKPTIKQFGQIPILPETRLFSVGFGVQKIDKLNCIEKLEKTRSVRISAPEILQEMSSAPRRATEAWRLWSKYASQDNCEGLPFSDPKKFGPSDNIMSYDSKTENACNTSYDTSLVDPNNKNNFVCKRIDKNFYKFCIAEDCFKYPVNMDPLYKEQLQEITRLSPRSHVYLSRWKNKIRENRVQKTAYTPAKVPVGNYYRPGPLEKIKKVLGIQKEPVITPVSMGKSYKRLQRLAKKRKLRITKTLRGKRVYKTKKELQKQLKKS